MNSVVYRKHAILRMDQRGIEKEDVQSVLSEGETIKRYPDDEPYPSKLLLGWIEDKPIHVVVAENQGEGESIVITVYEPDTDQWDTDFKERKS